MSGKNFKIFGFRGSLIGDQIMTLPILNYLEDYFPNSYKYFQIARKCSQAAPLYFNHPLIDKLIISDCDEGMGPKDKEIASHCNLVFDVMPNHPLEQDWPNYRNIYEETWVMAGLPIQEYHSLSPEKQRPKLVRWFNIDKREAKSIAIWPCAGYGVENKRNPSRDWYNGLCQILKEEGYIIYQFGHPNDFKIDSHHDMRHLSFMDQIKTSLGCGLAITTDSGSGLILGAYEMPQISLLTNHFPNHTKNLTAFAPNNINNFNFVGRGLADNINIFDVVKQIKQIL